MPKDLHAKDISQSQNMVEGFPVDDLFPALPDSSLLLVGTGHDDFMASRIARAVEDADASLLNMNVMLAADSDNRHLVHLRVNHRDPERVAHSLERYGYNIIRISNGGESLDDYYRRLDELMHYLSV